MAKTVKPLTELEIKNAPIKEKKYKLTDGDGLFVLIIPNGTKSWKLNYCNG